MIPVPCPALGHISPSPCPQTLQCQSGVPQRVKEGCRFPHRLIDALMVSEKQAQPSDLQAARRHSSKKGPTQVVSASLDTTFFFFYKQKASFVVFRTLFLKKKRCQKPKAWSLFYKYPVSKRNRTAKYLPYSKISVPCWLRALRLPQPKEIHNFWEKTPVVFLEGYVHLYMLVLVESWCSWWLSQCNKISFCLLIFGSLSLLHAIRRLVQHKIWSRIVLIIWTSLIWNEITWDKRQWDNFFFFFFKLSWPRNGSFSASFLCLFLLCKPTKQVSFGGKLL